MSTSGPTDPSTFPLLKLPFEVLSIVSSFINSNELCLLWSCGDCMLNYRLDAPSGARKFTWEISSRFHKKSLPAPPLLSHLNGVQSLVMHQTLNVRCHLGVDTLQQLPTTLTSLDFGEVEVRLPQPSDLLLRFLHLRHLTIKNVQLYDGEADFSHMKQLETLHAESLALQISALKDLPRSLSSIVISELYLDIPPNKDMLPPNLEHLTLKQQRQPLGEAFKQFFPSTLATLHLSLLSSSHSLSIIPAGVTSLEIASNDIQTSHLRHWTSLKSLTLRLPSSYTDIEDLIESLPDSLTRCSINSLGQLDLTRVPKKYPASITSFAPLFSPGPLSPSPFEILPLLPSSITELNLASLPFEFQEEHFRAIPSASLRSLKVDFLGPESFHLLPRRLTSLTWAFRSSKSKVLETGNIQVEALPTHLIDLQAPSECFPTIVGFRTHLRELKSLTLHSPSPFPSTPERPFWSVSDLMHLPKHLHTLHLNLHGAGSGDNGTSGEGAPLGTHWSQCARILGERTPDLVVLSFEIVDGYRMKGAHLERVLPKRLAALRIDPVDEWNDETMSNLPNTLVEIFVSGKGHSLTDKAVERWPKDLHFLSCSSSISSDYDGLTEKSLPFMPPTLDYLVIGASSPYFFLERKYGREFEWNEVAV